MLRRLSDLQKAAVFSALVVTFALAAAGLIRIFDLPSGLRSSALSMMVPAVTVLLMLLVLTREGYTKAGWTALGLHRLGLRAWAVAMVAPVLVGLVGTAIVWATPLATFSFVFGYLRLCTGSLWPAALAHSAHNGAWGTLAAFTVTANPVVINEYLVGDNGVLILLGTIGVAWWLGRRLVGSGQAGIQDKAEAVTADADR